MEVYVSGTDREARRHRTCSHTGFPITESSAHASLSPVTDVASLNHTLPALQLECFGYEFILTGKRGRRLCNQGGGGRRLAVKEHGLKEGGEKGAGHVCTYYFQVGGRARARL